MATASLALKGRGKGRPRVSDAAGIDRAIREAALRMLLDHGEAATMNAVAVAAGVSRKSLYARFSGKNALMVAVIRDLLGEAHSLDYDRRGTATERFQSYIRAALEAISQPRSQALQRLLAANPEYLGSLHADMVAASHTVFHAPLYDLLTEMTRKGEFVLDDVQAATRTIVRLILSESIALGTQEPDCDRETYANFLAGFLTRGLLPRP